MSRRVVGQLEGEELEEFRRLAAHDDLMSGGNVRVVDTIEGQRTYEFAIDRQVDYFDFIGTKVNELVASGEVEPDEAVDVHLSAFTGQIYVSE